MTFFKIRFSYFLTMYKTLRLSLNRVANFGLNARLVYQSYLRHMVTDRFVIVTFRRMRSLSLRIAIIILCSINEIIEQIVAIYQRMDARAIELYNIERYLTVVCYFLFIFCYCYSIYCYCYIVVQVFVIVLICKKQKVLGNCAKAIHFANIERQNVQNRPINGHWKTKSRQLLAL